MDESALKEQVRQGIIYSMRLLMIAKRSEKDIRDRLLNKGFSLNAIDLIVADLKQKQYIDDDKLAANYVLLAASGKHLGRKRLALDLRKKGVSKEIVSNALSALNREEERRIAEGIARHRYEKLKTLDPRDRKKKVYDFLMRRGFDYELCRTIVEKLNTNENN